MSDTPRTDNFSRLHGPNMCIEIARQLERELAARPIEALQPEALWAAFVAEVEKWSKLEEGDKLVNFLGSVKSHKKCFDLAVERQSAPLERK